MYRRGTSITDMSTEVSCSSLGREIEAEKRTYKIRKEQQRAIKTYRKCMS